MSPALIHRSIEPLKTALAQFSPAKDNYVSRYDHEPFGHPSWEPVSRHGRNLEDSVRLSLLPQFTAANEKLLAFRDGMSDMDLEGGNLEALAKKASGLAASARVAAMKFREDADFGRKFCNEFGEALQDATTNANAAAKQHKALGLEGRFDPPFTFLAFILDDLKRLTDLFNPINSTCLQTFNMSVVLDQMALSTLENAKSAKTKGDLVAVRHEAANLFTNFHEQ